MQTYTLKHFLHTDLNVTSDQSSKDNSLLEAVQVPITLHDDSFRIKTGALLEFEQQRNQMIQTICHLEAENKGIKNEVDFCR